MSALGFVYHYRPGPDIRRDVRCVHPVVELSTRSALFVAACGAVRGKRIAGDRASYECSSAFRVRDGRQFYRCADATGRDVWEQLAALIDEAIAAGAAARDPGVRAAAAIESGAIAGARVLGLRWPCARVELVAAYRARARQAHPDRGGTARAFIAVRTAYEAVERALGELEVCA